MWGRGGGVAVCCHSNLLFFNSLLSLFSACAWPPVVWIIFSSESWEKLDLRVTIIIAVVYNLVIYVIHTFLS